MRLRSPEEKPQRAVRSVEARLSPWGRHWIRALARRGHSPRTIEGYARHALAFEAHLRRGGHLQPPPASGRPTAGAVGAPVGGAVGTPASLIRNGATDGPSHHRPTVGSTKGGIGIPRAEAPVTALEGWTLLPPGITYDSLLGHLDEMRGLSPRTVSARFTSVGQYVKHLARHFGFPRVDMDQFWDDELRVMTKRIKQLRARRVNVPPTADDIARALALEPSLRNRAFILLAAKTGARQAELVSLDWRDVDLERLTVRFKDDGQHLKRTSFLGILDDETAITLRMWRAQWAEERAPGEEAVFISEGGARTGHRIGNQATLNIVRNALARVGRDHNVHSLRHWFSDTLRARGMPDHMIAYLRGDAPATTLDLYTHLQSEAGVRMLRVAYDAAMVSLVGRGAQNRAA